MSHNNSDVELALEDVFFLSTGEIVFGGRLLRGRELQPGVYEMELPGQPPLKFQGAPKMPGRRPEAQAVGTFDELALPDNIKDLIASGQVRLKPGQ